MLPQPPRRPGLAALFAAAALILACGEGPFAVPPIVSLSTTTIAFDAIAGGPNPPSQTVEVDKVGVAELEGLSATIMYTPSGTNWLGTPSWDQRTAPAVLTLQATTGSLAAGSYAAAIAISGDGAAPDTLNVTFDVAPGPSIALSDSSVTFEAIVGGVDPDLQEIAITNGGGGTLTGLAVGSIVFGPGASDWLMTPFAMSPTEPSSLTLLALTRNLVPGTYTAAVQITGAGVAPATVSVTFVVSTPPPILSLSEVAVEFVATQGGGNPVSKSVQLTNGGGGTLTGLAVSSITYDPPGTAWLGDPQPTSSTAPSVLTLEPQTSSLVPGEYAATVTVVGTGVTSRTLGVAFRIEPPPPVILLSNDELEFSATQGGANPTSRVVQITNGGGSALAGLTVAFVTYDPPGTSWLGTPLLSSASAPSQLTIEPQTGSLAAGTYHAAVRINGSGAAPDTVEVTFEVLPPPPRIALSTEAVDLTATEGGSDPTAQAVNVTNGGGGALEGLGIGAIVYDPPGSNWLGTPSLSSATAPSVLTLQAQTGALTAGSYEAAVEIVGTGVDPDTVLVSFVVEEPAPVIALSQSVVELFAVAGGDDPLIAEVTVSNGGGGTLTGLAVGVITYDPPGTDWLGTELSDATAPSTLSLAGVTGALAAGTYTASVEITGSGVAPDTISVTFEVAEPDPVLVLSMTQTEFYAVQGGDDPAIAEIAVTNGGGGTLGGLAVGTITFDPSGTTWLVAELDDTTAPTLLSLVPTTGTLAAGSYAATVEVTGAGVAPDTMAVTFVVDESPSIVLSSAEVAFEAVQGEADPSLQIVAVTNGGGGVLEGLAVTSITYVPDTTAWLVTAELSSQTAPADLTLAVETGTILAGTYQAFVEIVGVSVTPDTVLVTFAVAEPPPSIALSTSEVQLTGVQMQSEPDAQTVDITNGGGGTLEGLGVGSITYDPEGTSWLTVAEFSSVTAPSVLTLDAEIGALPDGVYAAAVEITGTGVAPDTVNVTFTVETAPMISVSPSAFEFDRMYSGGGSSIAHISNGGGGSLTGLSVGAITYEGAYSDWLQPAELFLDNEPAVLRLTARTPFNDPPGPVLPLGTYEASILIISDEAANSPLGYPITLTVSPDLPDLRVGLVELARSDIRLEHQTTITTTIRNSGTVAVDGCVTVRFTLIGISTSPIGDAIACGIPVDGTVEVQWEDYTCCDVNEGDYYVHAEVDPDNEIEEYSESNNTSWTDYMPVLVLPDLTVESLGWSDQGFGSFWATAEVLNNRANRPNAEVAFYLSADSMLDADDYYFGSDYQSVLGFQEFAVFDYIADTLPSGDYHLIAEARNSSWPEWDTSNNLRASADPIVHWTAPYALVGANPDEIQFLANRGESDPPPRTFTIVNIGGGQLIDRTVSTPIYEGTPPAAWLDTPLLVDSTVTLQARTGSLEVGTYRADLEISGVDPVWGGPTPNSPRTVRVTFAVQEPPVVAVPAIEILDDLVDFTRQVDSVPPTPQSVTVINSGDPGSTLSDLAATILYVGETDWLEASFDVTSITTGPAILTLTPTRGNLPMGTHTATVSVSGTDATNAPQTLIVTFRSPGITLASSSSSFPGFGSISTYNTIDVTNGGGASLSGLSAQVMGYGPGCSGWLIPSIGDTAPTELGLTIVSGPTLTCPVNTSGYTAVVRVSSPLSGNGYRDVVVTYRVTYGYQADVASILHNSCRGCHSGVGGSLNLSSDVSYGQIVNVDVPNTHACGAFGWWRVRPGNPQASYLMQSILGLQPGSCDRMPPAPIAPLDTTQRNTILQWILDGAPNN